VAEIVTPSFFSKYRRFWLYLAVFLFVGLSCAALNTHFNWVDDSYYLVVARALATGRGYTNIYLPEPTRHTHFPPGFPVLLSLPMQLGLPLGSTVIISKLMLILCGALALLALARLARLEGYSESVTTWAVALSAVSIVLISYTTRVASEMPYMLLSALALFAVHRYRQARYKSWWLPAAALLLSATILTRLIAIVLLAAVVFDLLRTREFKRLAALLAPVLLILLGWSWQTRGSTGTSDYTKEFAVYRVSHPGAAPFALTEPLKNIWSLVHLDIPRAIASILGSEAVQSHRILEAATLPLALSISLLTILPIILGPRATLTPTRPYIVLYLILIAIFPWVPSRYLIPIVPFLCIFFVDGLYRFLEWLAKAGGGRLKAARTLAPVALALCIASNLISDFRFVAMARKTGDSSPEAAESWNDTMQAYQWIDANTSQESIIGCIPTIEAHVYLFTGHKAVPLPVNAERWGPMGISYVLKLEDKSSYGSVERRIEDRGLRSLKASVDRGSVTPVYQNQNVVIYRVEQSTSGGTLNSAATSDR
jgi:hypothetical protein